MTTTGSQKSSLRFDSIEQEVFLNLWRTYDCLRALEDELFSNYELTAQQYNALRLLRAQHPKTIPTLTLADRLVSRAPDITRMLDKLEQREFISRDRQAENRRVVQVGITAAGVRQLEEIQRPLHECHTRQLGHLSPIELKRLATLLRSAREPHEDADGCWR